MIYEGFNDWLFINWLGISRDHYHKRRATGGKRALLRKKRKFELGRPAANTKVSKTIFMVDKCREFIVFYIIRKFVRISLYWLTVF